MLKHTSEISYMSWYAVEVISEAIEDTKELLLPFDLGTWLRLAIIVVFTGGGTGAFNPGSFMPSNPGSFEPGHSDTSSFSDTTSTVTQFEPAGAITGAATSSISLNALALGAVALLVFALAAFFLFLTSVFEFIYYQSLLDRDVGIRKNFRKHWSNGLQYFVFKLAYLLAVLAVLAGIVLGFMATPFVGVLGIIIGIPVLIALAVFSGLVHDFALPEMIEKEKGLITSWKDVWADIREEWKEVAVYLVVKLGIGVGIGIAVTMLTLFLLIPFILVFGALAILMSLAAEVLALIPVLLGVLIFVIALLGITVVTKTFIYFYILRVYHSIRS